MSIIRSKLENVNQWLLDYIRPIDEADLHFFLKNFWISSQYLKIKNLNDSFV